ncbi:coiled-coil domain-containing protein 60 isoform X2 [Monodelphis domestica]|uniref:coiled-coil domain-containing protein 60 isoform X2 n=1 Tax=Monodelphis domestica TaxID=13616 RepID=UPI0024E20332|nr:coiled-coil domain-containing protein 60 isoform X2 [Monodelphis domestica]
MSKLRSQEDTKNGSSQQNIKYLEKSRFHKNSKADETSGKSIRFMEREITNLKKDLLHSRYLMRSVKMGQGYFDILKAETAMRKKVLLDKKKEEEERNKFQPAKIATTEPSDSSLLLYSGVRKVEGMPDMILRPFTPVYSCLVSSTMSESHIEPLFRQLCALHWLLEALTIDHNYHGMRPVITCWNEMDPGGIKNTLKKINKDKGITHRWDHFIMPPKTKKYKMPAARFTTTRKSSRKASTISLTRTSGGSSPQSSMLSVNPTGSDDPQSSVTVGTSSKELEDNESSSTKQDDESIPISLQKLMEMVREDARRTVLTEDDSYKKITSTVSILKPSFRSDTNLKETTQKSSITDKSSSTSTESLRRPRSNPSGSLDTKNNVCATMRAKFFRHCTGGWFLLARQTRNPYKVRLSINWGKGITTSCLWGSLSR